MLSYKKFRLLILSLIITSLSIVSTSVAQNGDPVKTNKTDPDVKLKKNKERPKRKRYVQIIKNNTKGILYGNKCFEDFTKSRGYEYVVQPKGNARNRSNLGRFLHNFGVKFVILIKNGPFWKIKEKKKKKECKLKTGDYVGSIREVRTLSPYN